MMKLEKSYHTGVENIVKTSFKAEFIIKQWNSYSGEITDRMLIRWSETLLID